MQNMIAGFNESNGELVVQDVVLRALGTVPPLLPHLEDHRGYVRQEQRPNLPSKQCTGQPC
jgi:hypothetical protein